MTSGISIEFIDKVSSEFEADWEYGFSMDRIRKFLTAHVPEHSASYPTLLCEVAQIDIELRWRHMVKLSNQQSRPDLSALTCEIDRIPTTSEYLQLIRGQSPDIDDIRRTVLEAELKVRCKYGDAPLPSRFGIPVERWDKYEKLMPRISIWHEDSWTKDAPIFSPLSIGRQAVDEPSSPIVVYGDRESRFICSPLADKTISRQQVVVRAIVGKWFEIVNSSKNRDFSVLHQSVVSPGDSVSIALPCTINFDSVKVRLHRPVLERR